MVQVQIASIFLVGCPACLQNFKNFFCILTCSRDQATFTNITAVQPAADNNATVVKEVKFWILKLPLAQNPAAPLPCLWCTACSASPKQTETAAVNSMAHFANYSPFCKRSLLGSCAGTFSCISAFLRHKL